MFPLSRGKHQAEATLAAHSFILFSVAQSLRIKLSFPSQCWLPRYYSGILSGYKDAISTMDRSQNTSVLAISSQRRSNTMNPAHFPNGRDVGEPFHRHKSIHHLLGGGKVADILLWKDRNLSAGVLAAATLLWYLFDVVEYNIIPLLSQIVAIAMLVIFIWSNAAPLLNIAPPRIPEVIVSEHAFRQIAQAVHYRLAYTVASLYEIACGKDLKKFLLVIGSLLLVSEVGSSYSFTSLLYLGFLCAHTLPALYQRYEIEVDHLIARGSEDIKRFYKRVDSNLFSKIPRGPVKTKVY